MTGISEILFLLLLIVCILILPRMFKGEPVKNASVLKKNIRLSAKIRSGIIISIVYPLATALYLQPWKQHLIPYISLGIAPVFLSWAVVWILAGRKK